MSVYIGHASISEKGSINGAKGDSTGKEVCKRDWYSYPWDFMAIYPNEKVRDKIASACEAGCANNKIGYGQSDRNTLNTLAKGKKYDLSKITTVCNTDCSAFMNVICAAAGVVSYGSNGWTTSTMKKALLTSGFMIITASTYLKSADYCVRGAIYVNTNHHTVCGLTNGSKYKETLAKAGICTTKATLESEQIKTFKKWLNTEYGAGLGSGGKYTSKVKKAAIKAFQTWLNDCGASLDVDGLYGVKTKEAAKKYGTIKRGDKSFAVYILKGMLYCNGLNNSKFGNSFGGKCEADLKMYQKEHKLSQTGRCSFETWGKFFEQQ